MVFLKDNELRLRAVEPEDADAMWEFEADSSQWQANGMMAPFSRANLRQYAEGYDADPISAGQLRLIVETKHEETGARDIVGICDIYDISAINRRAFLGIYIASQHRRHHLATRTLCMCENYASQLLNLRILAAKICGNNPGSEELFVKCGYSLAGTLDDWIICGKESYPLRLFTKRID